MIRLSQKNKLALVLIFLLALIWFGMPYDSALLKTDQDLNFNNGFFKLNSKDTELSKNAPNWTIPITGGDPFKAHIEKNGLHTQSIDQEKTSISSIPAGSGTDPFKAHLEQQKKESSAAGVSPFSR